MAATVVISSNKTEKLMCTICLELFRSPRLLPCHHTFCLSCLHDLAARHNNTCFPCPSCRNHAAVPPGGVGQFQVNFYLEDDLAEVQNSAARPQSQQPPLQLSQQGKQTQRKTLRLHSTAAESIQHKNRTDADHHSRQQLVQEQEREVQTLRRELEQLRTHNKSVKKEQERIRQQLSDRIKNQQKRIQDLEADNQEQKKVEADLRQENQHFQERNRDQREKQVLKKRVHDLEKRLKLDRKQREQHEPRVQELLDRIASLERRLESEKRQLESTRRSLTQNIDRQRGGVNIIYLTVIAIIPFERQDWSPLFFVLFVVVLGAYAYCQAH